MTKATGTKGAQAHKAIKAENDNALTKLPTAIRKAFEIIGSAASEAETSQETKAAAALDVVRAAHDWSGENAGATMEARVAGWRDAIRALALVLAADGNRFAEATTTDAGTTAKLTGYGNNVASIAKGVIEFDLDAGGFESYRDVRKAVEAKRQEARRESDPDAAALVDAKAAADDAWKALRTLVFDTGDTAIVTGLAEALMAQATHVQAQLTAQAETEAQAQAA